MAEFGPSLGRDMKGKVTFPPGKDGFERKKGTFKPQGGVRRKPEELLFARNSVLNSLLPYAEKIIQLTYRTGVERKMKTDRFYISKLDFPYVHLDATVWNESHQKEDPSGKPFPIPLENVHFIFDGETGIWPAKKRKRARYRNGS